MMSATSQHILAHDYARRQATPAQLRTALEELTSTLVQLRANLDQLGQATHVTAPEFSKGVGAALDELDVAVRLP